MSQELTVTDITNIAEKVYKGGLSVAKNENQLFTLMLISQAEGIHPIKALQEYDIINGKPCPKTTTIVSRFLDCGGSIEIIDLTDKIVKAKFAHPKGVTVTIEWTIEMARNAGYTNNDTWKKTPRAMLRSRCMSEGIRTCYPSVLSGMHTADEMQDVSATQTETIEFHEHVEDTEIVPTTPPELDLKIEKSTLTKKLKELSLSIGEIKAFATYYNITDNAEAIKALNEDEAALLDRVKEFEAQYKDETK